MVTRLRTLRDQKSENPATTLSLIDTAILNQSVDNVDPVTGSLGNGSIMGNHYNGMALCMQIRENGQDV
jgi:hypothetical protein